MAWQCVDCSFHFCLLPAHQMLQIVLIFGNIGHAHKTSGGNIDYCCSYFFYWCHTKQHSTLQCSWFDFSAMLESVPTSGRNAAIAQHAIICRLFVAFIFLPEMKGFKWQQHCSNQLNFILIFGHLLQNGGIIVAESNDTMVDATQHIALQSLLESLQLICQPCNYHN